MSVSRVCLSDQIEAIGRSPAFVACDRTPPTAVLLASGVSMNGRDGFGGASSGASRRAAFRRSNASDLSAFHSHAASLTRREYKG